MLSVQPQAWTLIETEARDASMSAEQNTKFSSRANDYPEQGAGPQHHSANEHQQTCKFKLAHCPDPPGLHSQLCAAIPGGHGLTNKRNDSPAKAKY